MSHTVRNTMGNSQIWVRMDDAETDQGVEVLGDGVIGCFTLEIKTVGGIEIW